MTAVEFDIQPRWVVRRLPGWPVDWVGGTIATSDAKRLLHVTDATVWRWWQQLAAIDGRTTCTGSGSRYRVTPADLMCFRAFQAIDQHRSAKAAAQLRPLAARAILTEPRRWLLLSVDGATTFDEAEDAARVLADIDVRMHLVIDLWSRP